MKPTFIGLGVQKSATSWIHKILSEHPEICMAEGQEKDKLFFNYFYDRGFIWYESHYIESPGCKALGEFSTSYFYSLEAPKRIHDYIPDVRMIVCLRDPISRAFSNHKHEIAIGRLPEGYQSFEIAVKQNPMYLKQSLYADDLERWFSLFSQDQILVLIYEDIFKDPALFCNQVYTFLDVDPGFVPSVLNVRINESRVRKSQGIQNMKKIVAQVMKKAGLRRILDTAKKTGMNYAIEKANTKANTKAFPEMTPQTKDNLKDFFQKDKQRVELLLNRRLDEWL